MPLLAAEGGTTDEEGGLEDGSTELDLDSQQEALRADLDDVAPLGRALINHFKQSIPFPMSNLVTFPSENVLLMV